jgi:hypothetical protein
MVCEEIHGQSNQDCPVGDDLQRQISHVVHELQGDCIGGTSNVPDIDLLREFQKPKSESQHIIEIKEIKKQARETMWDYDQWFKILLDRPTF